MPRRSFRCSGRRRRSAGLAIAWAGYQRASLRSRHASGRALGPLVTVLDRRWYVDDVFEAGLPPRSTSAPSNAVAWVDRYLVDGLVNAVTWATWTGAGRLTAIQNGRVQDALYATVAGLIVLLWLALPR